MTIIRSFNENLGGSDVFTFVGNRGDLFWDPTSSELRIADGVTPGGLPAGGSNGMSEAPADGNIYVRKDTFWVPLSDEPQEYVTLADAATNAGVRISTRRGSLIVTDPYTESVSTIDLGSTTPDPGTITNLYINGSGRYAVGNATLHNANGLVSLEYINTPGQFFVINDVDGGNFGPGDRQSFGLVAEDIYDRTNLRGGVAPFTGGNSGGWSTSYSWYYTGGFPYGWTTYTTPNQTPGGSGFQATGTFANQVFNRNWWELCGKAGVGKSMRFGIANGALTDQAGTNYGNRLVHQLYVSQEMLDHPEASSLLPTSVINAGAGWYTQSASQGDYENMGQFADGNDKGYRFRWSTFGNTVLNQLPIVTGVSTNDQITAASGLSHYIVYNCDAADAAAANATLQSGAVGNNNRFWSAGTSVKILQFEQPYDFPNTPAANVFELKYTYLAAVEASPLFNNYQIGTLEEITETAISVAPLEKLHSTVCEEVRQAVTAYYLVRDFNYNNTALINTKLFDANQAAVGGQLINTYDAVTNTDPDDGAPEGESGEVLFPLALKQAILAKLELWMNTLPDN